MNNLSCATVLSPPSISCDSSFVSSGRRSGRLLSAVCDAAAMKQRIICCNQASYERVMGIAAQFNLDILAPVKSWVLMELPFRVYHDEALAIAAARSKFPGTESWPWVKQNPLVARVLRFDFNSNPGKFLYPAGGKI